MKIDFDEEDDEDDDDDDDDSVSSTSFSSAVRFSMILSSEPVDADDEPVWSSFLFSSSSFALRFLTNLMTFM